LDHNPSVGLVGAGSVWKDGTGQFIRNWIPISEPESIHRILLREIPFIHGTFMFRNQCLPDIGGGYDHAMPVAQDCDLLLKISERWDLANLPDILYVHYRHARTITAKREPEQLYFLHLAKRNAIHRRLSFGWGRLRGKKVDIPDWVLSSDRKWLAQRFLWWSASARDFSRWVSLRFLIISYLLDPSSTEIRHFVRGILQRKLFPGRILC
jgi:hypothetical protein